MIHAYPLRAACLALLTVAVSAAADPGRDSTDISAAQFKADVAFVVDTLAAKHPDPRFSTDVAAVRRAADGLTRKLPARLDRDEAWRRLATLNPLFGDAHLVITYPGWRDDTAAHLQSGGLLFPFEVALVDGQPVVQALLGGEPTALAGARIVAIDDAPSAAISTGLLDRVHGDTPAFRAHLLGQRWWLYHWKQHGAPARYRLELSQGARRFQLDVAGSAAVPAMLRDEAELDRAFLFESRPGYPAVLTVGAFDGAQQARLADLARSAFTRLRDEKTPALIIDISANGGGDDAMWLDNLMPYLASAPYRTGSAFVKRVLEPNAARGETAGQVVTGAIETWRQPQLDNPLRYQGKVYVRIGPSTYSSAVLFANVMRDFRFGTLIGTGGAARQSQSGGVRAYTLPHSKLVLWAPRFILSPPAGAPRERLLEAEAADPTPPACLNQGASA